MLANTLNTNEVKNAAGTEEEFQRIESNARSTTFSKITESPAFPHRLTVSHQETGTGLNKRRRSVCRVDKTVASTVDATQTAVVSAYLVLDSPIGSLVASTEMANTLANLVSFVASLGASTTILYDGSGNGATCLLSGGL